VTRRITINPATRLGRQAKIEILLDNQGEVEDIFWQTGGFPCFERVCLGRPVEEMPRITPNICGFCATSHNIASSKALDDIYSVEPTATAKLIRQLQHNASLVEDYFLHFFLLSAPDLVLGPEVNPAKRNILGELRRFGPEVVAKVFEVRQRCRQITAHIGSKSSHPEGGLPGGVSRGITEEERKWIRDTADFTVESAQQAMEIFKKFVLENPTYLKLVQNKDSQLRTFYMGLVDDRNRVSFYEGKLRVVDPNGKEYALFNYREYMNHIGEHVDPQTHVRLNYLKQAGWKGLVEDEGASLYRVGPLARLNVADEMATPLAERECEMMFDTLGGKPSHHTMAYHWAGLIEALQAAEQMQRLANDPLLTSKDVRNTNLKLKNIGIGCVEAVRGTLIHHYETDNQGLVTKAKLITATQNNAAAISLSARKAVIAGIKNGDISEEMLNQVEMVFRAYNPCLGCNNHDLFGL